MASPTFTIVQCSSAVIPYLSQKEWGDLNKFAKQVESVSSVRLKLDDKLCHCNANKSETYTEGNFPVTLAFDSHGNCELLFLCTDKEHETQLEEQMALVNNGPELISATYLQSLKEIGRFHVYSLEEARKIANLISRLKNKGANAELIAECLKIMHPMHLIIGSGPYFDRIKTAFDALCLSEDEMNDATFMEKLEAFHQTTQYVVHPKVKQVLSLCAIALCSVAIIAGLITTAVLCPPMLHFVLPAIILLPSISTVFFAIKNPIADKLISKLAGWDVESEVINKMQPTVNRIYGFFPQQPSAATQINDLDLGLDQTSPQTV